MGSDFGCAEDVQREDEAAFVVVLNLRLGQEIWRVVVDGEEAQVALRAGEFSGHGGLLSVSAALTQ